MTKGQSKDIFHWGQESPRGKKKKKIKKNHIKMQEQNRDFPLLFS